MKYLSCCTFLSIWKPIRIYFTVPHRCLVNEECLLSNSVNLGEEKLKEEREGRNGKWTEDEIVTKSSVCHRTGSSMMEFFTSIVFTSSFWRWVGWVPSLTIHHTTNVWRIDNNKIQVESHLYVPIWTTQKSYACICLHMEAPRNTATATSGHLWRFRINNELLINSKVLLHIWNKILTTVSWNVIIYIVKRINSSLFTLQKCLTTWKFLVRQHTKKNR